jgi:hypothetical protein
MKMQIKGEIEAISAKPGREGVRIGGEWFDATQRTAKFITSRKAGEMVYLEVENGNKIAFCGNLMPDQAEIAPKPPNQPKIAISQQDRVILAQSAEKGAIALSCAIIGASKDKLPAKELEAEAIKMVARLALEIENDIKGRLI